jgi:putative flippase GtrA
MTKLKFEVTKFTLVGAANFFLTLIVFTSLLKIYNSNYLVALWVSWTVGVLFTFYINDKWVFEASSSASYFHRLAKYFSVGLLSIVLNSLALSAIVEYAKADPFWVQFSLIPLIAVFNFITAKYWSLR